MNTGKSIRQSVERNPDAKSALEAIDAASRGECWLVGGSIRDAILGASELRDLDIVIRENDQEVFQSLDRLGSTYEFNRRGMRRYRVGGLLIDLIEPSKFYRGLSTIESILCFFDLKINALGLHLGSNTVLDHLNGNECIQRHQVGINWHRWNSSQMTRDEQWLLLLRLVRIIERHPDLRVESPSVEPLRRFVAQLDGSTWAWAATRFPPGEELLIRKVKSLIS